MRLVEGIEDCEKAMRIYIILEKTKLVLYKTIELSFKEQKTLEEVRQTVDADGPIQSFQRNHYRRRDC